MPNDQEGQVAPAQVEVEETEQGTETEAEVTDWEAEAKKQAAIAKRYKTKLEKHGDKDEAPATEAPSKETSKPGELDYGQKAFLATYGIKGSDELALVKTWVARTGDDIDSLVEDDIFQAKLTALREARTTKAATPSASRRTAPSAKDDVDFYLDKPFEEVPANLRTKVVNAKIARAKGANSNFSSNPIVQG